MKQMTNTNQINMKVLRNARKRKGWTQQQLADQIGCTKDTVSRWERGDSLSVRSHLRDPLCEKLQIKWRELTDSDDRSKTSASISEWEWAKTSIQTRKNVRVALNLVALRYDINPNYILHLAPLLFVIIAEQSLLWRKRRLDEINSLMAEAEEKLLNRSGHLGSILAASHDVERALYEEDKSLSERDVFGRSIDYGDEFEDRAWGDDEGPFLHYIRELIKDLPGGAVTSIEPVDYDMVGNYEISADTLEHLTGLSGGEDQGRRIINHIRLGSIDLKECIRFKRDNSESDYQKWCSDKLIQADEEIREVCPLCAFHVPIEGDSVRSSNPNAEVFLRLLTLYDCYAKNPYRMEMQK
ncbi:MAG: helix-turn-helix transcriptional regulator [Gammaproteobacteria bacterium]|nr:helix-turn-helix transcriptional regulator [Gammaproteobacteria bacterium]